MTKRQAYVEGHYKMPVPPVIHQYWTIVDWIRFIDKHGTWTVNIAEGEK